jgi:hypothetical protein
MTRGEGGEDECTRFGDEGSGERDEEVTNFFGVGA